MAFIELIGCTSAGKSTLAQHMVEAGRRHGLKISTSYEFVLNQYHLGWIKNHAMRMFLLNLLALGACITSSWRNYALFRCVIHIIRGLPMSVGWRERLKIARIALRNIGIHELVRSIIPNDQIVLADEGTIQIVHYLFVHTNSPPDLKKLTNYLRRMPLPDIVVNYRQPEEVLIARTLARGHKRIPDKSPTNVANFIRHALTVFDQVAHEALIQRRIIDVDGVHNRIECLPALEPATVALVAALIQDDGLQSPSWNLQSEGKIAH